MASLSLENSVTLLIVEDEPLVRMLSAEVLGEAGYHVVEAVNASEALEILDARSDLRLMITDVRMPGELNGYSLSRLVRLKFPTMPIIVVSGDTPPGDGDLPVGARFIPKPVSPSELVDAVAQFLDSASAVTQSSGESDVSKSPIVVEIAMERLGDDLTFGLVRPLAKPDKS